MAGWLELGEALEGVNLLLGRPPFVSLARFERKLGKIKSFVSHERRPNKFERPELQTLSEPENGAGPRPARLVFSD